MKPILVLTALLGYMSAIVWPFDQAFHLLLNVAVGGNWGGKYGVDEKNFPASMLVDNVRVYQTTH